MANSSFFNKPSKSPWESNAPRGFSNHKKKELRFDENNNFRPVNLTSNMLKPGFHFQNLGFSAHSGVFHNYYLAAKNNLIKNYARVVKRRLELYKKSLILRAAQHRTPNYNLLRSAHPRCALRDIHLKPQNNQQSEIVDITGDSPPVSSKNKSFGSARLPEVPRFRVNQPETKNEMVRLPNGCVRTPSKTDLPCKSNLKEKGSEPEDRDHPAVGVVITKKKAGYIARLL